MARVGRTRPGVPASWRSTAVDVAVSRLKTGASQLRNAGGGGYARGPLPEGQGRASSASLLTRFPRSACGASRLRRQTPTAGYAGRKPNPALTGRCPKRTRDRPDRGVGPSHRPVPAGSTFRLQLPPSGSGDQLLADAILELVIAAASHTGRGPNRPPFQLAPAVAPPWARFLVERRAIGHQSNASPELVRDLADRGAVDHGPRSVRPGPHCSGNANSDGRTVRPKGTSLRACRDADAGHASRRRQCRRRSQGAQPPDVRPATGERYKARRKPWVGAAPSSFRRTLPTVAARGIAAGNGTPSAPRVQLR